MNPRYLLIFLLLTATCIHAQTLPADIPGAQLIALKNQKVILSKTYGVASIEFNVPVTKHTIFSINSIAKIFTGVAILQLAEAHKISLDTTIGSYVDSLPASWQNITLKQLFAHLSGLPDIEELNGDSTWERVQKMRLQSATGTQFSYNATNYLLLQKVIEKYGQLPFEQFIKKYQFDVAGMQSSIYGNSYDVVKDKAPTYYRKDGQMIQAYEIFPNMYRSDAGAFSTAEDMAKWLMALYTHKLLKAPEKLWEPVTLNNGQTAGFDELINGYALGWPLIIRKEHPARMAIGGGRAAIGIYPEDDLIYILFTNLTGCSPEQIIEKLFYNDIGKSH